MNQATLSQKNPVPVTKIPEWVKLIELPKMEKGDPYLNHFSGGFISLICDRQRNYCDDKSHFFKRYAFKLMESEAIRSLNYIDVEFNPKTSEIQLHYIRIKRKGKVINALDPERVQLVQREEALNHNILDGYVTCHYLIPGLQVGDILEYAYSKIQNDRIYVDGNSEKPLLFNSVYLNNYHTLQDYNRILWPKRQKLYISDDGNALVQVQENTKYQEIIVSQTKPEVIAYEDDAPTSFQTTGEKVSFSSEKDWSRVVTWGCKFYKNPKKLSPELRDFIKSLQENHANPIQQVGEAISFCANEIAYTSLGGYVPLDPSVTFKRRYGDCKDKTLLLLTILKNLKVEAYPAYVNTNHAEGLGDFLPGAQNFNHVITCLIMDGKTYWIDTTMTRQGKSLDFGPKFSFGKALVLKEGERSLRDCVADPYPYPEVEIHETFDFSDPQKVVYKISSTYRYYLGGRVRSSSSGTHIDKLTETYLSFIQKYYEKVDVLEKPTIEDNEDQNIYTINESYVIKNFFEKKEDNILKGRTCFTEIDRVLQPLEYKKRKGPMSVSFPDYIVCKQKYIFGNNLKILSENFALRNNVFDFQKKVEKIKEGANVKYIFKTLKDRVSPDEFKSYVKHVNKVIGETVDVIAIKKSSLSLENLWYWGLLFVTIYFLRRVLG